MIIISLFKLILSILLFHASYTQTFVPTIDYQTHSTIIGINADDYSFYLANSSSFFGIVNLSSVADRAIFHTGLDSYLTVQSCTITRISIGDAPIVDSESRVLFYKLSFQFPSDGNINMVSPRTLVSCLKSAIQPAWYTSVEIVESIFEDMVIYGMGDTFVSGGDQDEQKVKGCMFSNLTRVDSDGEKEKIRYKNGGSVSLCVLRESVITESDDTLYGGIVTGLSLKTRSSFIASNNTFVDCRREVSGGDMEKEERYCERGCEYIVERCEFIGCRSEGSGGGMSVSGEMEEGRMKIEGCVFRECVCGRNG